MRRRRSAIVCLGLTATVVVAGCGSSGDEEGAEEPTYAGICVDKTTGVRLDDAVCADVPLPEEQDFQAVEAVPAGRVTTAPTVGETTSTTSAAEGSPATTGVTSTEAPSASGAGPVPTASAQPSCVPVTGPTEGATATGALPTSTGTPSATETLWEGACPPGTTPTHTPTPHTATTTVHHRSGGGVGWFFIPFGWSAPRVGSYAGQGSYAPPAGTTYSRGGVTTSGGTISKSSTSGGKVSTSSRGGFGSSGGKAGS